MCCMDVSAYREADYENSTCPISKPLLIMYFVWWKYHNSMIEQSTVHIAISYCR
jgi:hypothetical protein